MVFVNQKLVKNSNFFTHTETILISPKTVKRQLHFLSLSLAFTVQLCAMSTEGATRTEIAESQLGTVASTSIANLARIRIPDSLERIRADVSAAMAESFYDEGASSAVRGVSPSRETRLRRSFDVHKSRACLDLAAFAGEHDATGRSKTVDRHPGRPPRHKGPQTRCRNADGSPTRRARVAAIRV